MSGLVLRRAGTADAALIAALHGRAFADGWGAPSIAMLIAGPGGFALVASRGAALCGFALLQCVPPEAELLSIGVVPEARRRGVAHALLRGAAAELARGGADTMFLDVAADNAAAIALYRAHGFGDIARRARYYPGEIDAIVMRARLADIAV